MMPVGVLNLYGFLCFGCPGNLRPPYLRWHQRLRAEAELKHQEDVQGKMWARYQLCHRRVRPRTEELLNGGWKGLSYKIQISGFHV